jgi:hypothetical protein
MNFGRKAEAYIPVFRELETVLRDHSPYRTSRISQGEEDALVERWSAQREELIPLIDRAEAIAKKNGIRPEFFRLRVSWPGRELGDWGGRDTLPNGYETHLSDSVRRIVAAIDNSPTLTDKLRRFPLVAWKWLDVRGLAKWIVAGFIIIAVLALLKLIGYDLKSLTELVKAIRG